jgi:hypothetical protein
MSQPLDRSPILYHMTVNRPTDATCVSCCCTDRYPSAKMKAFAAKLRARGQHWVPIINPAVGAQPGFRAFDEGNRDDIWIKDTSGKPYVGQVREQVNFFVGDWKATGAVLDNRGCTAHAHPNIRRECS